MHFFCSSLVLLRNWFGYLFWIDRFRLRLQRTFNLGRIIIDKSSQGAKEYKDNCVLSVGRIRAQRFLIFKLVFVLYSGCCCSCWFSSFLPTPPSIVIFLLSPGTHRHTKVQQRRLHSGICMRKASGKKIRKKRSVHAPLIAPLALFTFVFFIFLLAFRLMRSNTRINNR